MTNNENAYISLEGCYIVRYEDCVQNLVSLTKTRTHLITKTITPTQNPSIALKISIKGKSYFQGRQPTLFLTTWPDCTQLSPRRHLESGCSPCRLSCTPTSPIIRYQSNKRKKPLQDYSHFHIRLQKLLNLGF